MVGSKEAVVGTFGIRICIARNFRVGEKTQNFAILNYLCIFKEIKKNEQTKNAYSLAPEETKERANCRSVCQF